MRKIRINQIFFTILACLPSMLLGQADARPDQSQKAIRFVDVAEEAGLDLINLGGGPSKELILQVAGNGAAFLDYDVDGDMDLLMVNGSTFEGLKHGGDPMAYLYQNNGGGAFRDVTEASGVRARGWGIGVCVADIDNDGFQDFYLTAYGPNRLFRNQQDGTFEEITDEAGVADPRWSTNCAFGDYDRDGNVDLYVANYLFLDEETTPRRGDSHHCQHHGMDVLCGPRGLPGEPDTLYRNNGDHTFTSVTTAAGIVDPGYYGFGVVFSDYNDDGWPDIYVANDSTPNFLFRNNRDGTFSEVGLEAGVAFSEEGRAQAGMGLDAGDYNNDGRLDFFVTNFSEDTNTLYRNEGDDTFAVVTIPANLGHTSFKYLSWGTGLVDLDNDGFLDIFVANGHMYPEIDSLSLGLTFRAPNQLYRNMANGQFQEVTKEIGGPLLQKRSSRGVAFGDYDNDGDLDILVTNLDEGASLLRNDGENENRWLTISLVGTESNRGAIGTQILLEAGHGRQVAEVRSGGSYLSSNDPRIHFGLGQANHAQRLEIRWPSGLVEVYENVPADQFLRITESRGMAQAKVGQGREE